MDRCTRRRGRSRRVVLGRRVFRRSCGRRRGGGRRAGGAIRACGDLGRGGLRRERRARGRLVSRERRGPHAEGRHQIAQPGAQRGPDRIEVECEHAGSADLGREDPHHQALDRERAAAGESRGDLDRERLADGAVPRAEQAAAALRDLGEDRAVAAQPGPEVHRRAHAHAPRAPLLGPAIERVQQQEPQGGRMHRALHHQLEARAAKLLAHDLRLAVQHGDPEGARAQQRRRELERAARARDHHAPAGSRRPTPRALPRAPSIAAPSSDSSAATSASSPSCWSRILGAPVD